MIGQNLGELPLRNITVLSIATLLLSACGDRAADTATVDEGLVAQSDDFGKYRQQFVDIAGRLMADGRCTADEIRDQGGFVKSVTEYRDEPVYFIYCGGMTQSAKLYVNAKTGETMR